MNDLTVGPTSSVGERVCAARKQAADARQLLEHLLESCARLDALCIASQEPTSRQALAEVARDTGDALGHVLSVQEALRRVQW